ncbi:chemotaxis protein CheW [Allocoleopsis franciscana]|uniref:CheW-like protein n=1 Tax=Allocoleopsis franciscana PCC 7113 TaxID=1173027 RepID=K9WHP7_9CYAN|nr:chemotaxis protein CheW [Allocoleopsis franciscana]AFZ19708.1 CheW-like protein [Allocoleopsis franciscana PCC 7113]
MNNLLLHLQSGEPELSRTRKITSLVKLIVFNIGRLNLALRIESVYKVVNHTSTYGSGLKAVGITHLGEGEITVVDLHQRFFNASQISESNLSSYLIVVQNITGELYGIPVNETPALMEVSRGMIRVLPESYRRSDTLDVASHVAVIPQNETSITIFVLDVDRLLPMFQELSAQL